jgi:hypothetical protein
MYNKFDGVKYVDDLLDNFEKKTYNFTKIYNVNNTSTSKNTYVKHITWDDNVRIYYY